MKTNGEWELKCQRCGRCCFEKVEHEGRVYYTDKPCDKLNLKTSLCTVYPDRHSAKPECMPLNHETLHRGILPSTCPYVAGIQDYNAPQLWDESDE